MASTITIKNNIPLLNKALLAAIPKGLEVVGQVGEVLIVNKIMSNIPPPNAESTVKSKGSSQTLIDTGEMMGAVSSEVRDNGTSVAIGVMGNAAAEKALYNEFGTVSTPERSFIRSTVNDKSNQDKMSDAVKLKLKEAITSSTIR